MPAAALVISDLIDLVEVREASEVVRELPVPTLVLTNLRPGAAWGRDDRRRRRYRRWGETARRGD